MVRTTTRKFVVVALGVSLVVGPACGELKPCFDVQPGDRIAITVVDVDTWDLPGAMKNFYDSGSPGECGFGFDILGARKPNALPRRTSSAPMSVRVP